MRTGMRRVLKAYSSACGSERAIMPIDNEPNAADMASACANVP